MLVTRIWSNRIVFGQAEMIVSKNLRISKEIFINSDFPDAFLLNNFNEFHIKTNCYLNLIKNYAVVWNLNFFPPKSSFLWDMPDLHKVWCSNHWLGRLAFGSDFLDARLTDWRILSQYKKCKSDSLETSGRWRRCLPQF